MSYHDEFNCFWPSETIMVELQYLTEWNRQASVLGLVKQHQVFCLNDLLTWWHKCWIWPGEIWQYETQYLVFKWMKFESVKQSLFGLNCYRDNIIRLTEYSYDWLKLSWKIQCSTGWTYILALFHPVKHCIFQDSFYRINF